MTFTDLLKQMDTVPGYFWADEARQLYNHTKDLPETAVVVECGCLTGRSTSVLATVAKERGFDLYVIDQWVVEGKDSKRDFWVNMKRIGVDKVITFIEGDSPEVAKGFENKSVDFWHLDTAHDHGHSVKELEAWLPKMKPGGICCFHDYGNTVFVDGIKRAVDEAEGISKLGVYNSLGVFRVL